MDVIIIKRKNRLKIRALINTLENLWIIKDMAKGQWSIQMIHIILEIGLKINDQEMGNISPKKKKSLKVFGLTINFN